MRLKLKPMSAIKTLAASASIFTFCMAPVAQGAAAANQKQLVNQFLKETKISTQKQTVGQFWQRVRHVFPKQSQNQMDQWVRINGDQPMPTVEATSFKGPDGKEQIRLNLLSSDGKTMTLTFTGDEDRFVKVNSVYLSEKDVRRYKNLDPIVAKLAKDPMIKKSLQVPVVNTAKTVKTSKFTTQKRFLKGREIAKLPTLRAQVDYLLRMRAASEVADKVFTSGGKKGAMNEILNHQDPVQYVWSLMIPDVNAATGPCVASGWIASYHQNSCARADMGRDTLIAKARELPFNETIKAKVESCANSGGLPCNPMIFGFEDNNGTPHCITKSVKTATRQCNERAPLSTAGKEKIIQSIVAAKGKDGSLCKLNGESTVSQSCLDALDNYTDGLRQHYSNAAEFCTSGTVKTPEDKASWVTRSDIKGDQAQACDALRDRYFGLAALVDQGPPITIAPPPIKEDNCAKETPGTKMNANGQCVCESTNAPPTDSQSQQIGEDIKKECVAAVGVAGAGEKVAKEEECSEWSWCKKKALYIGVGVGLTLLLAGLLLLKKDKKKDKKDPEYETPAPGPEPTNPTTCVAPNTLVNGVCTPPGSVIETPEPNPETPTCDAPNTIVNGVCTPPVIVLPEPPPSEGGTTDGTVINGGVR
ncbi:hypothetical protein ACLVWU_09300 [Bdellovibrio sp. HCB290]|uniref:hypothetical protein n=1 Tax=Bdellovibrio sp. HCB290 TaxID=3394356 RepID=UPI0039B67029